MGTTFRGDMQFQFGHERVTWSVRAIILTCTAVFAADLLLLLALAPVPGGLDLRVALLAFSRENFLSGYVWSLFTYMFMHESLSHFFFNMLMLYFFGPDVERALGTRQFIYFYVICGAVGAMANLLPFVAPTPVIGASGAVLGVLVAFAVLDPDRQVFLFPLPIPIYARTLVLIIIVVNVISSLGGGTGTSVATHLGGMAVGFAYMKGLPMFNAWRQERRIPKVNEPSKKDMDDLGKEVDNILQFKNEDKG